MGRKALTSTHGCFPRVESPWGQARATVNHDACDQRGCWYRRQLVELQAHNDGVECERKKGPDGAVDSRPCVSGAPT